MRKFQLTIGGETHAVSAERGAAPGQLLITVDGVSHTVEVEEEQPQEAPRTAAPRRTAPRPPAAAGGGGGKGAVLAPLPGTVLAVDVSEGQEVRAGDRLLVLEAMKMENAITAEAGGTVRGVSVHKGEKVEAGQKLMEIA